jgi:PAS domain S-box-containing protein
MNRQQGVDTGDGDGKIFNKKASTKLIFSITRRELLTIVLITLVGFAISFNFSWYSKNQNKKTLKEIFEASASERVNLIEDGLSDNLRELEAVCRLFETSSHISRTQFKSFILPIIEKSVFVSIAWVPRVEHSQRKLFESAARKDGIKGFRFTELGENKNFVSAVHNDQYYPVYYMETYSVYEQDYGFNVASSRERLFALELARDTGRPVATERIMLESKQDNQYGIVVFAPVYANKTEITTVEDRRKNIKGFVTGMFKVEDMIKKTLKNTVSVGLPFQMLDIIASPEKQLLYSHAPQSGLFETMNDPELNYIKNILFAGRIWYFNVHPNKAFIIKNTDTMYIYVLATGFVFTVILVFYLFLLLSQRYRIEELVRKRTMELRESEERWQFALEGAGDGLWDWNIETNKVYYSSQWKAMIGYSNNEIGDMLDEWDRLVHPDDREYVHAEVNKHLEGELPIYSSEYRLKCKDGTYKWILDRGKVINRTEEGKPLRAIGTHTDITNRKKMEEEKYDNERLKSALEMAGAVCHELNQPLQVIIGETEILAIGRSVNDEQLKRLQKIKNQINLIGEITRKLMSLRKYQVKNYVGTIDIVDIDKRSDENDK